MSNRPQRTRKLPTYLQQNYVVERNEDPEPDEDESQLSQTPSFIAQQQLETRQDGLRQSLDRYTSQAAEILETEGSKKTLKSVQKRIEKAFSELDSDVVPKLLLTEDAEHYQEIMDWFLAIQESVEQTLDGISDYLTEDLPPMGAQSDPVPDEDALLDQALAISAAPDQKPNPEQKPLVLKDESEQTKLMSTVAEPEKNVEPTNTKIETSGGEAKTGGEAKPGGEANPLPEEEPMKVPVAVQPDEKPDDPVVVFLDGELDRSKIDLVIYLEKIDSIIQCNGSRTRLKRLVGRAHEVYNAMKDLVEKRIQYMTTKVEIDSIGIWIHTARRKVEDAEDEVDEYLVNRVDDAPSEMDDMRTLSDVYTKPPAQRTDLKMENVDLPMKSEVIKPDPEIEKARVDVKTEDPVYTATPKMKMKPVIRQPLPIPPRRRTMVKMRDDDDSFRPDVQVRKWLSGGAAARSQSRRPSPLKQLLKGRMDVPPKTEKEDPRPIQQFFQGMAKPHLPKFDGNRERYQDWREQFSVFVECTSIPVRHKMIMLKGSLVGRPSKLVERLGYTLEQFDMALFKLDQRYGGEDRQIQHYLDTLMSMAKVSSGDLEALEDMSNYLYDLVAKLHGSGHSSELVGVTALYTMVKQRIPSDILVDYKNLKDPDESDGLATFADWLNEQVCIKIEVEDTKKKSVRGSQSKPTGFRKDKSKSYGTGSSSTATDFHQGVKPKKSPAELRPKKEEKFIPCCSICKEPHFVVRCQKWLDATVPERWKIAQEHRLCYRCMRSGHQGKLCHQDRRCNIQGCTQNHHRHLHYEQKQDKAASAFGVSAEGTVQTVQVGLRVIPVMVLDAQGRERKLNAFLDDGSDSSYISKEIVMDLGCDVQKNTLTLSTLTEELEIPSGLTSLVLESLDGDLRTRIGVRVVDKLCKNVRYTDWNRLKANWKHLHDIPFPSMPRPKGIDLLIGADHPELLMSLEERMGQMGEPVARRTPLGWTCIGTLECERIKTEGQCYFTQVGSSESQTATLDEEFKRLWNMDILEPEKGDSLTPDEKLALQKVSSSCIDIGSRYEVPIPWREERPDLPDNRSTAERRLRSLEYSLKKRPEVAEKYCSAFADLVKKGYIVKISKEEEKKPGWYLPHFAVLKEDKETTKVRIVYDSASTHEGTCLNDTMFSGPNLQADIVEILLNFRRRPHALIGDIKEMFNQVVLHPEDRKFHRLLWRDLESNRAPDVYEAVRLVFGDKASPFLAMYVLQEQAKKVASTYPEASQVVTDFTYMDDVIGSFETSKIAKEVREQLNLVVRPAGFNIRRWCSNSPEVLDGVAEEDRAVGVRIQGDDLPSIKTLGVWWDAKQDELYFTAKGLETTTTKRQILSRIAVTFDPLQLLSPVVIRGKILLQETWLEGLEWDEPLPEELQRKVDKWIGDMRQLGEVRVSRCYRSKPLTEVSTVEIHNFVDASKLAYAAASYIRFVYFNGSVEVCLVAAKSRVAPVRAVSIPRLELMAAVLGVKLALLVARVLEVPIGEHHFWTDSTDVVHWIRGQSRKYKPFIANRVAVIHESTSPRQWQHVPGKLNPADDATRGLSIAQMCITSRWFRGPKFLHELEIIVPSTRLTESKDEAESLTEPKDEAESSTEPKDEAESLTEPKDEVEKLEVQSYAVVSEVCYGPGSLIGYERFSSWVRLVRVIAYILKFVRRLKKKWMSKKLVLEKQPNLEKAEQKNLVMLTSVEFEEAEKALFREIQLLAYGEALSELQKENVVRKGSLKPLSPFLDGDGVMRVGGRLQFSDLPYDVKHPVILPPDGHMTELIMRKAHAVAGHSRGVNAVLAETRQRFWIVRGREAIKKLTYRCYFCRLKKDQTTSQIMAPLPTSRVLTSLKAFTHVGVDFAGPFITKLTRRVTAKRYICIFTCMEVRAVHLEMVYSLETDGFLLGFSRMVSRRGKPKEVDSDNGSNFIGAERELRELIEKFDIEKIENSAVNQGITWKWNPPYGSHHGGVFESLIKSAKKALYAIVGDTRLTDEELLTVIVEVEGLLNSRPLTYCSSDVLDEPVLTPNHFLVGQCGGPLAPEVDLETSVNPRKRWRFVQDLLSKFWTRWNREYLTEQQVRRKWALPQTDLRLNDIVVVFEPGRPRGSWPVGKVVETFPGEDGHVRTVRILSRGKEYIRPITRLVPLVAVE